MRILIALLAAAAALVDCVGDSSTGGGDAAPDVTVDDGASGDGATDAASDVGDGGAAEAGDAGQNGCGTQPFPDLSANCDGSACIRGSGITCEPSAQACKSGNLGRPVGCGSASDCDGSACCLPSTFNVKAGCPSDAVVGSSTVATLCSTQTNGGCPTSSVQVCSTNVDCQSGTCTDTVFQVNQTVTSVHFGTCQ